VSRPVPLIRRFAMIPESYFANDVRLEQMWPYLPDTERLDWAELDSLFRVVILADPGAGKTFELRAEAQRLAASGRAAFFIRIEDIDETFGSAFEVGDAAKFERWLAGIEEGWFFLDSVDEVRLETQRAFETAIRAFAARIHTGVQRAHVVISSRPYAWDFSLDGRLMQEVLPYALPVDAAEAGEDESQAFVEEAPTAISPLKVFRLAELDNDDIRLFAGHRGVGNANALLEALDRAALMDLARIPFDLEDLIATWEKTKSLDGRLHVLEQGLARRLSPSATEKRTLPLDRALAGARRLALAATLLGEANLRLSAGEGGGLDTAALLPDWTESEVDALLRCGIFSDPIYGAVRFRHRETRELLAAQHLSTMLESPARRAEVEDLIFRRIYGVTVIPPRMRPLLPWLILYDPMIRVKTLALSPELATEGGDASQLPLGVRRDILRDIVRRIVETDQRGGDNSQLARIAQQDLAEEARALITAHSSSDDAIFFLARLVWQGKMAVAAEALVPVALDRSRDDYTRIVSVRAVATILEEHAGEMLWADLLASGEMLSRRLLAELVNTAPPTTKSVRLLLSSLDQLQPYERFSTTGLSEAIHEFIHRLPMLGGRAPEKPLALLVEGLAGLLGREPHIERRECKVSKDFESLMAPALDAIARLVIGRASECLEPVVLGVICQIPALRDYGESQSHDEQAKLGTLIPRWPVLNDALFWHSVDQLRATGSPASREVTDAWDVEWMQHLWAFDAASFVRTVAWITERDFADDKLVALTRSFRTYAANGRQRAWRRALWRAVAGEPVLQTRLRGLMRPPPSRERRRSSAWDRRWKHKSRRMQALRDDNRAKWVARIRANPDLLRASKLAPGQMSQDQAVVMESLPSNSSYIGRGAGTSIVSLVPEFGQAVADAFADGARVHWRAYRPELRSDGISDTTIPYPLIFGMVGLEIEAGPDGTGLATLSEDEAKLAMRYAPRELNGFPTWFEPLYNAHPEAGLALVWREAQWELGHTASTAPLHYILSDLAYRAPWLHADLAPLLLDWLTKHGAATDEALRHGRTIVLSGGIAPGAIASLARARVDDGATPVEQMPAWFALWVDSDPEAAIPELDRRLSGMVRPDDSAFAERFIVALVGGRRSNSGGPAIGAWRSPAHLKALYLLMNCHIRVAEDIHRANTGVYTPGLRDDAQDARDSLFSRLAEIPGQATYDEILTLAAEHPQVSYRAWMQRRAQERAVEDSERSFTFEEIVGLIGRSED